MQEALGYNAETRAKARIGGVIVLVLVWTSVGRAVAAPAPPTPEAVRALVATLRAADESEPALYAEWDAPRSEDVIAVGYSPKTGAYFKATAKRSLAVRTPDGREFGRMADGEALKQQAEGARSEPKALAIVEFVPQSLRGAIRRAPEAIESIERLEGGGLRVEAALVGDVLGPPPPGDHTSLTVWFDGDARVVKWTMTGYDEPVEPKYAEMGGVRLPTDLVRLGGWRLRTARHVTTPDAQFFEPAAVEKLVVEVAPARVPLEPDGRTLAEAAGIGRPVAARSTRSWGLIVAGGLLVVVGVVAWIRRRA